MVLFEQLQSILQLDKQEYTYQDIYSYRQTTCLFQTNSEEDANWLKNYFQYHLHYYRDEQQILRLIDDSLFTVYAYVDQLHYSQVFDWIEELIILQMGGFQEEIAEISFSNGQLVINRKEKMIVYRDTNLKNIYYILEKSTDKSRLELMKTVRSVFTRQLEKEGYYAIHASAVEKDGKAILFCGAEGAGKTTILLGLLEKGYHFIADDKVYVGIKQQKLRVISWPGSVGITLATTMHFNQLIGIYADLASLTLPQIHLHALALDKMEENEIDKVDLTVEETASLCHCKFVREAEVSNIFILDEFESEEDFQSFTDASIALKQFKSHFHPLQSDQMHSLVPFWFPTDLKCSKKERENMRLTLEIISRSPNLKKISTRRFDSIEQKINHINQGLGNLT